jgi:hypothetical protein
MDMVTVWTVAVGIWATGFPAIELRALAKQLALPAGAAEEWDAIGTFTIRSEKAATTVKLYYADSDSIADKSGRGGGIRFRMYPNFFSIHAVYREGDAPWKHKVLYRAARVGFWKVAEVKPETVTLQVRSKARIPLDGPFTDEELKRIYEPVALRLRLKDGLPALK